MVLPSGRTVVTGYSRLNLALLILATTARLVFSSLAGIRQSVVKGNSRAGATSDMAH